MKTQRKAHAVEDEIALERFRGDRYEPHIVMETQEKAVTPDQIQEVVSEGLTLRESSILEGMKQEVLSNEP